MKKADLEGHVRALTLENMEQFPGVYSIKKIFFGENQVKPKIIAEHEMEAKTTQRKTDRTIRPKTSPQNPLNL